MNEFLELVKERHDPKLWKKGIFCPHCKSKKITIEGSRSTLVGYIGEDMNHTWTYCCCKECNESFTYETKGKKNVWFTSTTGKVLLGIPHCFESYIYTCKFCDGDVVRKYFSLEFPDKEVSSCSFSMRDGKTIPHQSIKFVCTQCGENVVSTNGNFK